MHGLHDDRVAGAALLVAARSPARRQAEDLAADHVGLTVVDPQGLGRSAGRLDAGALRAVDEALSLVLGL